MNLSKFEIEKITLQVRTKLLEKGFEFESLTLIESKDSCFKLNFNSATHRTYKNVRLFSYESYYKETPLYTMVYLNLRFLFGKLESPKCGIKITSFKMNV